MPILRTTLYRNLMQASNFGGKFDQLFFWIFYEIFTEDDSLLCLYHDGVKKLKMTKNSNQGGPALNYHRRWRKKTERERGSNLRRQRLASPTAQVLVAQTTQPVQKNWLRDEL